MSERDLDARPYSPDEQRVVDWLNQHVPAIGAGDDPIGFLLASYEYTHMQLDDLRAIVTLGRRTCGRSNMNCLGAKAMRYTIEESVS